MRELSVAEQRYQAVLELRRVHRSWGADVAYGPIRACGWPRPALSATQRVSEGQEIAFSWYAAAGAGTARHAFPDQKSSSPTSSLAEFV